MIFYLSGKLERTYSIPFGTKIISTGAFADLVHLEQLIIPQSITTIGGRFVVRTSIMKYIVIYRYKNGTSTLTFSESKTNFDLSTINSSAIKYVNTDMNVMFQRKSVRFMDVGSGNSQILSDFNDFEFDNITIDSLGVYKFRKCATMNRCTYFNLSHPIPLMIFILK